MEERNNLKNKTGVLSGYDFNIRITLMRYMTVSAQRQSHCLRHICAQADVYLTRRKLFHNSPKHRTIK